MPNLIYFYLLEIGLSLYSSPLFQDVHRRITKQANFCLTVGMILVCPKSNPATTQEIDQGEVKDGFRGPECD